MCCIVLMRPNQVVIVLSAVAHSLVPHDYSIICVAIYFTLECLMSQISRAAFHTMYIPEVALCRTPFAAAQYSQPSNAPTVYPSL